jgi:hypothetical protein
MKARTESYGTSGIRILAILLCSLLSRNLQATNDNYPAGARSASMGTVGVMCADFWSIWHNQAGLGFYPHLSAGTHHENRFVVPESGFSTIGLTLPTSTGTFGISWSYFGYSRYHENKFGLALGKSFHDKFAAGLQLDYLNTCIDNEQGRSGTVAIEAGILAEPVENLLVGFHVFNPTASRLPKLENERIPVILRMGLGYRFGDRLFLGVETEKDLDVGKAYYKTGVEYKVNQYIYVRTGISVQEYVQHSFGLGFRMQRFQADVAFSFQQLIGYTPYLSLRYDFR